MSKNERIANLEVQVGHLNAEIERLRRELEVEQREFRRQLNDLADAERRRQPYQPFMPIPVIGPAQPIFNPQDPYPFGNRYKVTC
jgi:hypothetical protein